MAFAGCNYFYRAVSSSRIVWNTRSRQRIPVVAAVISARDMATSSSKIEPTAPPTDSQTKHAAEQSDKSRDVKHKQGSTSSKPSNLVMQIILPKSLVTEHQWPTGPLMAQSAHAATAVLHLNADNAEVQEYLSDLEGMRKSVLEIPDENALKDLASKLDQLNPSVPYHLWTEQPENIPTALALAPNRRPKALKVLLDQAGCRLWK